MQLRLGESVHDPRHPGQFGAHPDEELLGAAVAEVTAGRKPRLARCAQDKLRSALEDACHFDQKRLWIGQVLDCVHTDSAVERLVAKREWAVEVRSLEGRSEASGAVAP